MATKTAVAAPPKKDTVTMRGTWPYAEEYDGLEVFYEGELPVSKGIVEVPRSNPIWVLRLKTTGYEFVDEEDAKEFENIIV